LLQYYKTDINELTADGLAAMDGDGVFALAEQGNLLRSEANSFVARQITAFAP
jgi:hypothetical protein